VGTRELLGQLSCENAGRGFSVELPLTQGGGEVVPILLDALFEGNFAFLRVMFLVMSLTHS